MIVMIFVCWIHFYALVRILLWRCASTIMVHDDNVCVLHMNVKERKVGSQSP